MQISKIVLTSALLAVSGAQSTDGGFSIPDLNSLTSALGQGGTSALGDITSAFGSLTDFSIPSLPPQLSSVAASISSQIAAAGTNTAEAISIFNSAVSAATAGTLITPTAGAGSGGNGDSASGGSGNGQSSSSGNAAAPTAVKAGGALAAAGLAALAFL